MKFAAPRDQSGSVWRKCVALAVFVVAVVCGVDRASASCGDWLADHAGSAIVEQPLAGLATDVDNVAKDAPRAPVPCDGPLCRRSSPVPSPAPSAPSRTFEPSERWCGLIEDSVERPSIVEGWCCEPAVNWPDGHRPPIERPPSI